MARRAAVAMERAFERIRIDRDPARIPGLDCGALWRQGRDTVTSSLSRLLVQDIVLRGFLLG